MNCLSLFQKKQNQIIFTHINDVYIYLYEIPSATKQLNSGRSPKPSCLRANRYKIIRNKENFTYYSLTLTINSNSFRKFFENS